VSETAETEDALVGQTLLGRLRVLRRIGAGGMGAVYEVEHLITHHRRALKVLHPRFAQSGEAVSRLVREAGVAGRVGSDAIVETFDVGRLDDGSTYILMELLDGATLGELVSKHGRFAPPAAARIARRICEGLALAHDAGFVHRDLKPDNVFLTNADPVAARVKILDFGIATMLPGFTDRFDMLTKTGATPGTPLYMAPEQMTEGATVDARADLYAVGLVLYEMLSGRRPYQATTLVGLVTQVQTGEFIPLSEAAPGIDPALEALVHRAIHRDRETRFPDARAMAEALGAFDGSRRGASAPVVTAPAAAPPSTKPEPAALPPPVRSSGGSALPWILIAALALLVVGGAGAGVYMLLPKRNGGGPSGPPPGAAGPPGSDSRPAPPSTSGLAAEADIAALARRGRHDECLALAEAAETTASIVRLRLSCASGARRWDAYERACQLQERLYPEDDPQAGCRNTLSLIESGARR
jgi:serine/threonine-protein kinase